MPAVIISPTWFANVLAASQAAPAPAPAPTPAPAPAPASIGADILAAPVQGKPLNYTLRKTYTLAPGSGYVTGVYKDVPLTGGSGTGKTASISVSGGVVTSAFERSSGTGYVAGDVLGVATSNVGGGSGSGFSLTLGGYTGSAVVSQQWYKNAGDGTGPQAIAGAASATLASVPSDGGWISVRGTLADGSTFASPEFTTQGVAIVKGPVVNAPYDGPLQIYALNANAASMLNVVSYLRVVDFTAGHDIAYADNVLAPGSYAANSAEYNFAPTLAVTGGTAGSTVLKHTRAGSPPTIAAVTAPSATGTRPAGNTGNGFYVAANGSIYDPMDKLFLPWGTNKLHSDLTTPGLVNSGANTVRAWLGFNVGSASTNTALIDSYKAAGMCTKACLSFGYSGFSATFSGAQMTVTAMNAQPAAGYIMLHEKVSTDDGNPNDFNYVATILSQISGTPGGVGVYQLSAAPSLSGTQAMKQTVAASGNNNPWVMRSIYQSLANIYSTYSGYQKYIWINPGNEWGPGYVTNISAAGTGYIDGVYTNVPLTGGAGTGKQALIRVVGGKVTDLKETTLGSGYATGDVLSASNVNLGGAGSGFTYTLTAGSVQAAGAGYAAGTYTGVSLLGGTGTGKVATIVVSGTGVSTCTETTRGTGYTPGDILTCLGSDIGGATGAGFQFRVGPGNTTWRDEHMAGIPKLRAAGWTCPISVDVPGSGQDAGNCSSVLTSGLTVAATDTFKNIIFSPHVYGYYRPGTFGPVATSLRTTLMSQGVGVIVGEFAQGLEGTLSSPTMVPALEVMSTCAGNNFGCLGWAWDDNPGGGDQWFPQVYASGGYATSNPNDLTLWGKTLLLDPVWGLQNFAVKATTGSFA